MGLGLEGCVRCGYTHFWEPQLCLFPAAGVPAVAKGGRALMPVRDSFGSPCSQVARQKGWDANALVVPGLGVDPGAVSCSSVWAEPSEGLI